MSAVDAPTSIPSTSRHARTTSSEPHSQQGVVVQTRICTRPTGSVLNMS